MLGHSDPKNNMRKEIEKVFTNFFFFGGGGISLHFSIAYILIVNRVGLVGRKRCFLHYIFTLHLLTF
jgi:hypothetical protein